MSSKLSVFTKETIKQEIIKLEEDMKKDKDKILELTTRINYCLFTNYFIEKDYYLELADEIKRYVINIEEKESQIKHLTDEYNKENLGGEND